MRVATEGSLVHDADLLLSVFVIAMMMCMRSRVLHRDGDGKRPPPAMCFNRVTFAGVLKPL